MYLDHAGATLYSDDQAREHAEMLMSSLYGNPHSRSASSTRSSDAIAAARHRILRFVDVLDDDVDDVDRRIVLRYVMS